MVDKPASSGFTIIELLIVFSIIAILAAVLIPNVLQARTRGQLTAGTAYARDGLVALASMQAARGIVDYARTANPVLLAAGGTTNPNPIALYADNAAGSESFDVGDYLAEPQHGNIEMIFYSAANTGSSSIIEVEQNIATITWCTELDFTTNTLIQERGACNAAPG